MVGEVGMAELFINYELCQHVWGGRPATTQIDGGLNGKELLHRNANAGPRWGHVWVGTCGVGAGRGRLSTSTVITRQLCPVFHQGRPASPTLLTCCGVCFSFKLILTLNSMPSIYKCSWQTNTAADALFRNQLPEFCRTAH